MTWIIILETILNNTVLYATPLILAAVGSVLSERSGIVNLAIEGFMIIGAFTAAVVTILAGDSLGSLAPWLGIMVAFLAGAIFSLPHALVTIQFRADQVVSGVAMNFLAAGISVFLVKILFQGAAQTTTVEHPFVKVTIPGLTDIPILGRGLLFAYPTSYFAILAVIVVYILLYRTRFGLRLRSIGEHPRAADSLGISVQRYRYIAVMLAGGLGAMGGGAMSIAITGNFQQNTIAGHGFMALAAMIFGKWHPVGAMWASLFFGFATALAATGQVIGLTEYVPAEFLIMLPYLLTILALAGVVGRARTPAALGRPYIKGER